MVTKSDTRATLAKRRADVAEMFDGVATRYDLMNGLMTGGQHLYWRHETVRAIAPYPGMKVLDLAAGTGTSSRPLADAGAIVVSADLSFGMLAEGKKRWPDLGFVQADALDLPFADATFDAVTISYGIRNFEHTDVALREMRRVTRPGGVVVINEFSTPTWGPFRTAYRELALKRAIPLAARLASSNARAYDYLAESILAWPDQPGLAALMAEAGWHDVEWKNLSGGAVALHRARA